MRFSPFISLFYLIIILQAGLYGQTLQTSFIESEKKVFLNSGNSKSCSFSSDYDVKYYRCCWNIDPAGSAISGNINMEFLALANLDSLQVDASSGLSIDSVFYHQTKLLFSHYLNDVLTVKFISPLPASHLDSLLFYYHGSPQATGFGSFVSSTHGQNNKPIVWTLSEPYGAKDWWPCKQTLADKADSIDVYITYPQGNKAVSNGLLKQTVSQGTVLTSHWKHKYPIATYLVCAAVTDYVSYSDTAFLQSGKLPVSYYVFTEDSIWSRQTESQLLQTIHFYDSLFIPYPFLKEKYGHAQFGWGGGMEHQTMTFVGGFAIELLVHELAHHWFGDRITCGSWTDIWLNEGFAVFCSSLAEARLFGTTAFKQWQVQQLSNIVSKPDGSVFVTDTTSVSRIFDGRLSYSKGSYLLHMLKWKLGDSLFLVGIRNYLNDPVLAYSFARTGLLKQHLESASGQNLSNFFNQWFYGEGYPKYQLIWSQDAQNHLSVTLNQNTSHSSVAFFEMPVPVQFRGQGNKDTLIVFNHTASGQEFTFPINFKCESVVIDPDIRLVSNLNTVLTRQEYLLSFKSLVIYPNPASSQLNVQVNNSANSPGEVDLYDVFGRCVLKTFQHTNKFSMDVSTLANGVYFMKLNVNNVAHIERIIISGH